MHEPEASPLNWYVVERSNNILAGPFDGHQTAVTWLTDHAFTEHNLDVQRVEGCRYVPEYYCTEDPKKTYNIYHVSPYTDTHCCLASYNDEYNVGLFDSDGVLIDGTLSTCESYDDALAAVAWTIKQWDVADIDPEYKQ